ncbi:hypothetical protein ACROYT_G030063 [Oculina patagonica]
MPSNRLRIVLVTCMLLFIIMEGAKPVLGKKDKKKGMKAMVNALAKTVEGMENLSKCKPCLLIEQLTERLNEFDEEIEKLKNPSTTSPPLPMDNPAPRGAKPVMAKKDKNKGTKAMVNALKIRVEEMENLLKCKPCLSIAQLIERLNKIDDEIEKLKHPPTTSPPPTPPSTNSPSSPPPPTNSSSSPPPPTNSPSSPPPPTNSPSSPPPPTNSPSSPPSPTNSPSSPPPPTNSSSSPPPQTNSPSSPPPSFN